MNFRHVIIVFKKELVDMFRDKKTIISSILIPIFLFPAIYGFMNFSQKKAEDETEKKAVDIVVSGGGGSALIDYLRKTGSFNIVEEDDVDDALKSGTIKAAVFIGNGFDEAIGGNKPAPLTVQYDDSNQTSMGAAQRIEAAITQYSSQIAASRLVEKGIDPAIINPISITEKTSSKDERSGVGMMIFSMLLPLMLAIYSATSVMPAATDNGAGEKERGTIEPLLATQAQRTSLLTGKYLAITVAGIIGTMASMCGLFIAQKLSPELLGSGEMLPPVSILIIALAAICITLIFAALELAISFYARSFKEAQTYLSPLTIIVMVPAFAVYMLDPKSIPAYYFSIPLMNLICVIKELVVGVYKPLHIAVSFGWGAVYIVLSALFTRYMFTRESVIFRA